MKILLAAAVSAALCGSAVARPVAAPAPAFRIVYADLDLANPADAREMVQRVRDAATKVCRDARKANLRPAALSLAYCRSSAERRAVDELRSSTVRQAYMDREPAAVYAAAR